MKPNAYVVNTAGQRFLLSGDGIEPRRLEITDYGSDLRPAVTLSVWGPALDELAKLLAREVLLYEKDGT